MKMNWKDVTPDTWIRTISSFIFIANMIFQSFGIDALPISDEDVEQAVSGIVGVVGAGVLVRAWWKNNSFTEAAQKADEVLKNVKDK